MKAITEGDEAALPFLRGISTCYGVRQESAFLHIGMRNCARDEGRPLGAGLQEQVSNHLKLLWAKAIVVSVEEKAHKMRQV